MKLRWIIPTAQHGRVGQVDKTFMIRNIKDSTILQSIVDRFNSEHLPAELDFYDLNVWRLTCYRPVGWADRVHQALLEAGIDRTQVRIYRNFTVHLRSEDSDFSAISAEERGWGGFDRNRGY